jgi:CheY-like chemotaxis protein
MQLRFEAESKPDLDSLKDSIGNLKIAVVDDDFVIQELLKNTFLRFGTTVKVYSDGSEFLKDLMVDNFDLVFLDLLMPNVDGFEVLNAMKIMDMPQSVIVISAVSRRETMIRAFKMGRASVFGERRAGRPRLDHIDSKIPSLFPENDPHSVWLFAQELDISLSTVHARLIDVLGFSL